MESICHLLIHIQTLGKYSVSHTGLYLYMNALFLASLINYALNISACGIALSPIMFALNTLARA